MRALLCFTSLASAAACLLSGPKADFVLRDGKIITLSAERPVAEALAVTGGRITAVGTTAEINDFVGQETRVLDLDGALAVPGFIDSHAHFMDLGFAELQLDLVGTRSSSEIARKLKDVAATLPAPPTSGEEDEAEGDEEQEVVWIRGHGWDQNDWKKKEFPTAAILDQVAPDRPVFLTRIDMHVGWANSKAMELAGVDHETPDLDGGEIIRDEEGNPTGVFIDLARDLITNSIPDRSDEDRRKAFQAAQDAALRAGITSVHDAGVGARDIELYRDTLTRGDLKLRLYLMLDGSNPDLLERFFSHKPEISPWLTIRSVKLVADGALGSRGAALLDPYADRPDWWGLTILTEEDVYNIADRALSAGYQLNVHAIGDRANREVLNAFQRAFDDNTAVDDPRFRIEHAQILDDIDIRRFAQLGVIASMQGVHATSDMPWVADRIGEERSAEGAYVWQKLLLSGTKIANGTDAPVERISALESIYGDVPAAVEFGRVAAAPVNTLRQQTHRCQEISVCF